MFSETGVARRLVYQACTINPPLFVMVKMGPIYKQKTSLSNKNGQILHEIQFLQLAPDCTALGGVCSTSAHDIETHEASFVLLRQLLVPKESKVFNNWLGTSRLALFPR